MIEPKKKPPISAEQVHGLWHATVERCANPTPENIKAHIEAVKNCGPATEAPDSIQQQSEDYPWNN